MEDSQTLRRELKKLEAQEMQVLDMQLEARMKGSSSDVYARKLEELSEKKTGLQRRIKAIDRALRKTVEPTEDQAKFREALEAVSEALYAKELSEGEKNRLLSLVIQRIFPTPEMDSFRFEFRPFSPTETIPSTNVNGRE